MIKDVKFKIVRDVNDEGDEYYEYDIKIFSDATFKNIVTKEFVSEITKKLTKKISYNRLSRSERKFLENLSEQKELTYVDIADIIEYNRYKLTEESKQIIAKLEQIIKKKRRAEAVIKYALYDLEDSEKETEEEETEIDK